MRALPAGWPDPGDVNVPIPQMYLYLPGSSWPPADAEKGLPAGYALVVGDGSVHREFKGALMPGQVRAPSGFSIASATCEIAMPSTGRLAPWKTGSYKIAAGGPAQLIASYDGPTGATAFSLGKFRLDPLVAKASESSMRVNLMDGMLSLRQRNHILQYQATAWNGTITDATNNKYDPSDLINSICTELGIACVTPDLGSTLTSIWFDPKKDTLTCLQELVAANLAAITSDETGAIQVHPFEDLNGGTAIVDTVTIESTFDDLEFTLDPDDAFDRVELTYKPPAYVAPGTAGNGYLLDPDWKAPAGMVLAPGETYETTIYPKRAVLVHDPFVGSILISQRPPSGDIVPVPTQLDVQVTPKSTGEIHLKMTNPAAYPAIFMRDANVNPSVQISFFELSVSVAGPDPVAVHDDGGEDAVILSSGVDADVAFNSLSIDVGVYIQTDADAQRLLDRITAITSTPRFKFGSVRVPLDLRRQLVDSYALRSNDAEFDLQMKGMVTAYDLTWNAEQGEMAQTVDLAILPFTIADLDAVWAGKTIADLNAYWAGKTIADLNANPLGH